MKKVISLMAVLGFVFGAGLSTGWASEAKGSAAKAGSESKAGSAAKAGSESKAGSATKAATVSPAGISIVEMAIATGVEQRLPVGVANKFAVGIEKLYCYTKVAGGTEGSKIVHRWKKGDLVMAEVKLNIGGSPWRTFSSKSIMKEWSGAWSVEILDGDQVIETKSFVIE